MYMVGGNNECAISNNVAAKEVNQKENHFKLYHIIIQQCRYTQILNRKQYFKIV